MSVCTFIFATAASFVVLVEAVHPRTPTRREAQRRSDQSVIVDSQGPFPPSQQRPLIRREFSAGKYRQSNHQAFVKPYEFVNRFADKQTASITREASVHSLAVDQPMPVPRDLPEVLAKNVKVPATIKSPGGGLYLLNVFLLPRESAVAVSVMGAKAFALGFNTSELASEPEDILSNLTVGLGVRGSKALLCTVAADPKDLNTHGISHMLVCPCPNLRAALTAQVGFIKDMKLEVQVGDSIVPVSVQTLSASAGHSTTRLFTPLEGVRVNQAEPLPTSVVISYHGRMPPYLTETFKYLSEAGISHVYFVLGDVTDTGTIHKALDEYVKTGFVSIWDQQVHFGERWTQLDKLTDPGTYRRFVQLLALDWALYQAKYWDMLQIVGDYDELVVPTHRLSIPRTIDAIVRRKANVTLRADLSDLCFLKLCPLVTYGGKEVPVQNRTWTSRAQDYPYMDGGIDGFNQVQVTRTSEGGPRDFCVEKGISNIYPKSIVVVQSIYKSGLHEPGACASMNYKTVDEDVVGPFLHVTRDEGLVVQHFTEMFEPGRFVPGVFGLGHIQNKSYFSTVWAGSLEAAP